ncbi:MAG: prolyl oligopeptidase [Pirellulaceae bacterium]|nr:MAG: prolyl oligopeptidase [Pirellulaceae bacterium]
MVGTRAVRLCVMIGMCLVGHLTYGQEAKQVEKSSSEVTAGEDPYLWLEDVGGERSLAWVRAHNRVTQERLESHPEFDRLRTALLEVLESDDRIPMVSKRGEFYYNFWRDRQHIRGIWRRTTLESYRQENPRWDVLLDVDALSQQENESWVWDGASILRPSYDRALVELSRGGADANVTREFDLNQRTFVEDGFYRPEAKGGMDWIDRDTVFIYTDFGEGTLTSSGYPRIVKRWRRGTPLEEAEVIYEGQVDDMYISAYHDDSPGYERDFVRRAIAFYNDELYLLDRDGELTKIDVPNSASKRVVREHLFVELREPWEIAGRVYTAGSLLVIGFHEFMKGQREFAVLFEPTERTSLASFSPTRNYVLINAMEDVKNRIYVASREESGWELTRLDGAPGIGTVSVSAVDADESDAYWMTVTDFLTPTTLYLGEVGGQPEPLKQLPHMFNSAGLQVSQHFATSADGTQVPYFLVGPKDLKLDGENPTLLYGYGGFEIALTPTYSATVGRAWLEKGGVYVVANIRGGGEYGPRWHQAALKRNRLRAYEDFAAVAEDLIRRGVTSPRRLGIQGGSNGGLLVGNMVTKYPHLFAAAVCQVPLLDMRRYHLLLAGASWMAEYGNPDVPEEWEFIRTYSPYHQVRPDAKYPAVLFLTSTRDDRVHPGHARKMMALMESQGHDVLYYENIEGGHGGAADNRQRAYMLALAFTFLYEHLFDPAP